MAYGADQGWVTFLTQRSFGKILFLLKAAEHFHLKSDPAKELRRKLFIFKNRN